MHQAKTPNDSALLTSFYEEGDQWAFRQLVDRHIDRVFSTALRRSGNRQLAEEATQDVFTSLARKAGELRSKAHYLSGWLHLGTCYATTNLMRREARLKNRERSYAVEQTQDFTPAAGGETSLWEFLSPILDETLDKLRPMEREVIILRYIDNLSMRQIGKNLGISDDAAQKRSSRALEKLANLLRPRVGATISGVALSAALSQHAIQAAPSTCITACHSVAASVIPITLIQSITTGFIMNKILVTSLAIPLLGVVAWVGISSSSDSSEPTINASETGEKPVQTKNLGTGFEPTHPAAETHAFSGRRLKVFTYVKGVIADFDKETNFHMRGQLMGDICLLLPDFPEFGMEWLMTLSPVDKVVRFGFERFGSAYTLKFPDRAETILANLPNDSRGFAFLTGVSSAKAQVHFEEGFDYFSQKQKRFLVDDQTEAFVSIFGLAALSQPVDKIAPFLERIPDHARSDAALDMIAKRLFKISANNGAEVAAWVAENQDDARAPEYFKALILPWAGHDPMSASTWMAEQPPSAARDEGIKHLIAAIGITRRPEEAFGWARAISDSETRAERLRYIYRRYRAVDRQGADEMVRNDADLTVEEKHRLLGTTAEQSP